MATTAACRGTTPRTVKLKRFYKRELLLLTTLSVRKGGVINIMKVIDMHIEAIINKYYKGLVLGLPRIIGPEVKPATRK